MSDLRDLYPDTYELGKQSFQKIDDVINNLNNWKQSRFESAYNQFRSSFGEDERTALIIRELELNGIPGLPDDGVLNAMFKLVEDTFLIALDLIALERIRI